MILVTGGAGFIGSALVWKLNEMGYKDIVVADRMGLGNKWKNLVKRQISYVLHKDQLFDWIKEENPENRSCISHGRLFINNRTRR